MKINKIIFMFLLAAFACTDQLDSEIIPIDDGGGGIDVPIDDGDGGTTPPPNTVPTTKQEFYNAGYTIGRGDADWLVSKTWIEGTCFSLSYELKTSIKYYESGQYKTIYDVWVYKLKRTSYSCPTTTVAQELAFDNFISIYPHQVGYIQNLESRISSSLSNDKAFYEGILAGFKNRLCGWSITMPFNFTYCDAIDLPGRTTVLGSPS